jgi:hypothetical protein
MTVRASATVAFSDTNPLASMSSLLRIGDEIAYGPLPDLIHRRVL